MSVHRDVLSGPPPSLEAWTLLTWLAARTTTVRLLPNVLALPNRHPAVLAKMAETLSRLAGGRLILALGGGAVINHQAFGAFGLARRSAAAYGYNVGVLVQEGAASRGGVVAGGPEEVAAQLAAFVRGGFSFLNLSPAGDDADQRRRLAEEVVPVLRAQVEHATSR